MNKINGRTPEEIKRGLARCPSDANCNLCLSSFHCDLEADALAYIQQLERERDAAVEDMKEATLSGCHVCKQYYRPDPAIKEYACRKFGSFKERDFIADDGSIFCGSFEWRGVQEEEA